MIFSKKSKESEADRISSLSDDDVRELVRASGLEHIAFIMDGNGRWATKRSLPREAGHVRGGSAMRDTMHRCDDFGIKCVTVYAFSTENWKRPKREIDAIMDLLDQYIAEGKRDNLKNNAKYRFIGDIDALGEDVKRRCRELEEITKDNRLIFNVALNYGSRAEIVHAVNKLISEGKTDVTEEDFSNALYTAGVKDPDLIVRTAGEYRLSNFLMWQAAYSEIYITDTLWPDFDRDALVRAIYDFSKRKRNFGAVPVPDAGSKDK